MSRYDKPIWNMYIEPNGKFYIGFDYDVCVGLDCDPEAVADPEDRRLWNSVKMKRVDAIGYTENEIHLFEVKPIANAEAVGQIQLYEHLFSISHKPDKPTRKIIVCAEIDPDVETLARVIGIIIHKVGIKNLTAHVLTEEENEGTANAIQESAETTPN